MEKYEILSGGGHQRLIEQMLSLMMEKTFRVGFVLTTYDKSFDPNTELVGTWERIKGRFLWAADAEEIGATGGEKTVTLTPAQMPSHAHTGGAHAHGLNSHTHTLNNHTHTTPNHTHTFTDSVNQTGITNSTSKYLLGATTGQKDSAANQGITHEDTYGFWKGIGKVNVWMASSGGGTTGAASGNTGAATGNTASGGAVSTTSVGGGQAHDNMPPYIAVYMWRRVA